MLVIHPHLRYLNLLTEKTLKHLDSKNLNTIEFFCVGMIQRIHDSSNSLKLLFEHLDEFEGHEFSIGILIRPLILDSLIFMNLMNSISSFEDESIDFKEIEKILEPLCEKQLADGLATTVSYIESVTTFGFKTEEDKKNTFNKFASDNSAYFEPHLGDGSKPKLKHKKVESAKQLFESLAQTQDLKELSKIYDSYALLSKYDHIGILYYQTRSEPISEKIKKYRNILPHLILNMTSIHLLLSKMNPEDDILKSLYISCFKYYDVEINTKKT